MMKQRKRVSRREKVEKGENPTIHRKANTWEGSYGFHDFKMTASQQELLGKIHDNTICFIDSPPGTGKSTAVLYAYVKEYLKDSTKRILVIRTPVEAGGLDKVGFLPDSLEKKLEVHFASTKKILEQLLNKGKVESDLEHSIQFKVPNFELGATWDNCLVLLDECQQLQPMIMKLLLERIGVGTKVCVVGDSRQLYATDASKRNGLTDAIERFFDKEDNPKYNDIAIHRFTVDEVQRSEIVKTVIRAYSD